ERPENAAASPTRQTVAVADPLPCTVHVHVHVHRDGNGSRSEILARPPPGTPHPPGKRKGRPRAWGRPRIASLTPLSVQQRFDPFREARARPVQPALHRTQVHARDLRDLLVALALQLP